VIVLGDSFSTLTPFGATTTSASLLIWGRRGRGELTLFGTGLSLVTSLA